LASLNRSSILLLIALYLPFQNHFPEFPRQPYENILSQAIDCWNKTHPKYENNPKSLPKLKFFLGKIKGTVLNLVIFQVVFVAVVTCQLSQRPLLRLLSFSALSISDRSLASFGEPSCKRKAKGIRLLLSIAMVSS